MTGIDLDEQGRQLALMEVVVICWVRLVTRGIKPQGKSADPSCMI
ncbi:MAG: hypothetical protein NTV46_08380 [Verrucomicrobia bacterium]|nr:hypothetical protein [Verrucomicrobiota bacterium]